MPPRAKAGRKRSLLGPARHKLQPKLRMIANGNIEVNAVRAEQCAGLAVQEKTILSKGMVRVQEAVPLTLRELRRKPRITSQKAIEDDVVTDVFVQMVEAGENVEVPGQRARRGDLVRATVPLSVLPRLLDDPNVAHVEMGEVLKAPVPIATTTGLSAPALSERRFGTPSQHRFGQSVLIGIIDVGGFDFAHPDFLDEQGRTRFIRIWDQGGDARPSPADSRFSYGAEFTDRHLNAAIDAAGSVGVRPQDLERQSQLSLGSHGTHVASIAAGNRGLCRKARIAGVLVSLPTEDLDRRQSFYDSTRLVDAVDYLVALGESLGLPVAINISLGTNGHAHDGSGPTSRWLDSVLAKPGHAICVAAGNAGQEAGESADDIGWIMGRIHTSGQIPAAGLEKDVDWVVVGNGIMDLSENELELWFSPQDRFAVSVRPPGAAAAWIGPIEPRQYIENQQLEDGTFLSVYNELYQPANGCNYIAVYLSPLFSQTGVVGVTAGTWRVRLHGREIRDGRYHGWVERDDPRRLGRVGAREAWSFPSFFTTASMVDHSTVSSLACGQDVISVANLDVLAQQINVSSSQGPTRDGRTKPDVAAPGTDIVAANGFSGGDDPWIAMTGTSMASPFVTGVAGLMLAVERKLTAAQIEGIMHRTARPLPGASFAWSDAAGFGVIDPDACLAEAVSTNVREDLTQ